MQEAQFLPLSQSIWVVLAYFGCLSLFRSSHSISVVAVYFGHLSLFWLSQHMLVHRYGEPGLLFASKMTDFSRKTSMPS